jgi:hypothetical protein
MAPNDDDDDRRVKEMLAEGTPPLDPTTQAELERWFGLPSATQLEEEGKVAGPVDMEMQEVVERRAKALAAIDPALLDEIRLRTEDIPNPIGTFKATIDVRIDANGDEMPFFDFAMLDRVISIAEPRDVEIPDALIDDLKECTPQALLRDLHRPEQFFDKTFEIVDAAAEQRLDIVAEVRNAMKASWKLPAFGATPLQESRAELARVRAQRKQPWTSFLPHLPNRSVTE